MTVPMAKASAMVEAAPNKGTALAKDGPMLSFLLSLAAVLVGAVVVRIELEEALLPRPPHGPHRS